MWFFFFSFFTPEKFTSVTVKDLLSGEKWTRQINRSIFDYLPIYAKAPPDRLSDTSYEIVSGKAEVADFQKGTDWFAFSVKSNGKTNIRISQYYFPFWKISANNEMVEISKENELGLMEISLGGGNYDVVGKLTDTPVRRISNLVSLFTLIGISGVWVISRKSKKRTA